MFLKFTYWHVPGLDGIHVTMQGCSISSFIFSMFGVIDNFILNIYSKIMFLPLIKSLSSGFLGCGKVEMSLELGSENVGTAGATAIDSRRKGLDTRNVSVYLSERHKKNWFSI